MENRLAELIKNTFIFGLGLIGSKAIQFFLLPFFTNELSAAEYGSIELVVTLASLMIPVVTLGLSDSVLRFGLSDQYKKSQIFQSSVFFLVISSSLALLLFPVFSIWDSIKSWTSYLVLIIIVQSIRTNFSIFVKIKDKSLVYSVDSIVLTLVTAILDIWLIKFCNMGIEGYFIAEIMGNIISILFLFLMGQLYQEGWPVQIPNLLLIKSMAGYSFPLIFNGISWWVANFSDRAILNIFYSESYVGIYSVSAKIPAIITTALSMFTQAWTLTAVKEYEAKNRKKLFQRVYDIYIAILFLGVTFVILIIKPFIKLYVGKNFFESWKYIPFLLVGTAFLGISNYFGAIYSAAKLNKKEVKSTIICAISNIFLNFVLIPRFGIIGAVFATMCSYIIIDLIRIWDTKRIISIDARVTYLLFNLLILIVISICMLNENNLVSFLLGGMGLFVNMYTIYKKIKAIERQA